MGRCTVFDGDGMHIIENGVTTYSEGNKMKDLYVSIEEGLYNPHLDFPKRAAKPLLRRDHSSKDIEEYLHNFTIYEAQKAQYELDLADHRKDRNECLRLFKKDALTYCGILNHPKAERAFTMASEDSPNMQETLSNLEELAELLTD